MNKLHDITFDIDFLGDSVPTSPPFLAPPLPLVADQTNSLASKHSFILFLCGEFITLFTILLER